MQCITVDARKAFMKFAIRILLGTSILASTNLSFVIAQEIPKDELKKIEKKLQERETFEVKFSQQLKTGLRKREALSRGTAIFGKPNLFRWVLEHPAKQEMIFDGTSLVQYDKDAKAATRLAPTADKRRELEEVIAAATSIEVLLNRYDLEKSGRDASSGNVSLTLKPKTSSQGIKSISLKISAIQNFVEVVNLEFSDGSSNYIAFSNPQILKRNANTFKFVPPSGVKVSEMR